MRKGFLLIISAPSGTGKSTVCRKLLERDRSLGYSVSCTTRPPRRGEVDGRHYRFYGKAEFQRLLRRGEFLEWAEVHGNYYGTPKTPIETALDEGRVVLADIDVQGEQKIRRRVRDAVSVFLFPPSWTRLERRLRRRRDTDEAVIARRMRNACTELRHSRRYDYWVVNDRLMRAVRQVESIIETERLRARRSAPPAGLERWRGSPARGS
ncbi:MAG: guanylate kinase [Elusimicrobiota bacterium]|jgi:guanylate kinase